MRLHFPNSLARGGWGGSYAYLGDEHILLTMCWLNAASRLWLSQYYLAGLLARRFGRAWWAVLEQDVNISWQSHHIMASSVAKMFFCPSLFIHLIVFDQAGTCINRFIVQSFSWLLGQPQSAEYPWHRHVSKILLPVDTSALSYSLDPTASDKYPQNLPKNRSPGSRCWHCWHHCSGWVSPHPKTCLPLINPRKHLLRTD